jgi:acid stress-induced BolA-like protein IbaG/YrbA
MMSEELKVLLENELPGCFSQIEIKGSHFNILVVSGLFDGKRAIQRQQMIYAVLEKYISSGAIHAINMKLFSEEEWQLQS